MEVSDNLWVTYRNGRIQIADIRVHSNLSGVSPTRLLLQAIYMLYCAMSHYFVVHDCTYLRTIDIKGLEMKMETLMEIYTCVEGWHSLFSKDNLMDVY